LFQLREGIPEKKQNRKEAKMDEGDSNNETKTGMVDLFKCSMPSLDLEIREEMIFDLAIATAYFSHQEVYAEWKAKELLKGYEKDLPIIVVNIKEIDVNTRQITYAFSTPEWS